MASIYQVARGALSLEIDIKSWEEAYQQLQATGTQLRRSISTFLGSYSDSGLSWSWHDHLLDLTSKSIADFDSERIYEEFKEKVKKIEQLYQEQPNERLALRYSVIRQLTLTALRDPNPTIRKESLEKLESLTSVWDKDKEIAEGLLEGIGVIAKQGYGDEAVNSRDYLKQLYSKVIKLQLTSEIASPDEQPGTPQFSYCFTCCYSCFSTPHINAVMPAPSCPVEQTGMSAALVKWLDNKTLQEKLATPLRSIPLLTDRLFKEVKRHALVRLHQEIQAQNHPIKLSAEVSEGELRAALRARYQEYEFKNMPSFLGEAPTSVKNIECYLKLHEQKKIKEQEGQNHLAQREERLQWAKTPIELKDLFKSRNLKPNELEKEIYRVLLVGEAGTGKTSLTRKLAYDWAVEKWGQEFIAVYLLPIRKLKVGQYDKDYGREQLLAQAISQECFPDVRSGSRQSYLLAIERQLKLPNTLIILDGLDEHSDPELDTIDNKIIQVAQKGKHRLLLTSRPYGITKAERDLVDMEVDHMGLSERQRDNFVKSTLDTPAHLLQFIRDHKLDDMSLVPVNLRILCALWRDNGAQMLQWSIPMGLSGLYRKLVDYVWERFENSSKVKTGRCYTLTDRSSLFQDLEQVAFKSLRSGSIIIDQALLTDIIVKRSSKLLTTTGLLLFQNISSGDRVAINPRYQFPHLTFQEYFTGRWLARQFLSGKDNKVKDFLKKYMYVSRYRRTLSFTAGELAKGMQQELRPTETPRIATESISKLLQMVNNELPREVLGFQHLLVQLYLLNEWLLGTEDSEEKTKTLLALEREFDLGKDLFMWFSAGLRQHKQPGARSTQMPYNTLLTVLAEASGVTSHYSSKLLPRVLGALKDSKNHVRTTAEEALRTLVEQGADVAAILPHVVENIKNSKDDVRKTAIKALSTLAQKGADVAQVFPVMLEVLKDNDPVVRKHVIRSLPLLARKGADVDEILIIILSTLKDNHKSIRSIAEEAMLDLATVVEKSADMDVFLNRISNILQDQNEEIIVRRAAIQALHILAEKRTNVTEVLPLLQNALRDSDSVVHTYVIKALLALAKKGIDIAMVLPHILNALKTPNLHVRRTAVEALRTLLEDGTSVGEILPLISDTLRVKNYYTRKAAIEALPAVIQKGTDIATVLLLILSALKDQNDDLHRAARKALRTLVRRTTSIEKLLPHILNGLQDGSYDVRIASIKALQTLIEEGASVTEILPHILSKIKDDEHSVRIAATQ
ncbi:MAG: HEAT repeat domain-containing protein, partial [Bacteroidota bacterium]